MSNEVKLIMSIAIVLVAAASSVLATYYSTESESREDMVSAILYRILSIVCYIVAVCCIIY